MAVYYKVEALQGLFGACEYDPRGPVLTFVRTRRRADVCRTTYRFLLAGHWVRIVDDRNDQLLSGPFNPKLKLPLPDSVLPQRPSEEQVSPSV